MTVASKLASYEFYVPWCFGTDQNLFWCQFLCIQLVSFHQVTENGKQEKHLVATVGKFSVIWNFQQVKDSNHECYRDQQGLKSCYCYKVVLKDESIVDSRFMHEKFATSDSPEAPLVVATPMKVSSFSIANRRWLRSSFPQLCRNNLRSCRFLFSLFLFPLLDGLVSSVGTELIEVPPEKNWFLCRVHVWSFVAG